VADDPELPPSEREHLRHRDRKRETRMVVDNAGVKRVMHAVEERRRRERERRDQEERP
jgi:hypothetical protein